MACSRCVHNKKQTINVCIQLFARWFRHAKWFCTSLIFRNHFGSRHSWSIKPPSMNRGVGPTKRKERTSDREDDREHKRCCISLVSLLRLLFDLPPTPGLLSPFPRNINHAVFYCLRLAEGARTSTVAYHPDFEDLISECSPNTPPFDPNLDFVPEEPSSSSGAAGPEATGPSPVGPARVLGPPLNFSESSDSGFGRFVRFSKSTSQ